MLYEYNYHTITNHCYHINHLIINPLQAIEHSIILGKYYLIQIAPRNNVTA